MIFYMSSFHTYCRGTFFTLFDKDIEPNYFWKIWASEASWVCFCCFCIDIPRQSPSPPPPPPSCWCPCALQAMSCTPPPILSPPSCWRPGASWTTRRCSPRSRCSTSRCTQASTPLEGERRIELIKICSFWMKIQVLKVEEILRPRQPDSEIHLMHWNIRGSICSLFWR